MSGLSPQPARFTSERASVDAASSPRIPSHRLAAVKRRLSSSSSSSSSPYSSSPALLRAVPLSAASGPADPEAIRLVASDVDGTLLCPKQTLLPRVAAAVGACELEARVPLLLATGKAPGAPWLDRLLRSPSEGGLGGAPPERGGRAGVFMQGLFVADAAGKVLYSRSLDASVVEAVGELVEANASRLTLTAYCTPASSSSSSDGSLRTRVLSSGPAGDERAERLVFYGEPRPEPVTPLPGAASGATALAGEATRLGLAVHKLIVMFDADSEENEGLDEQLRASILALLGGGDLTVSLTSALPGMTEVLPPGASKADGLLRYLGELDLPPDAVLAVGDAENDVEMLLLAGIGAAVANAGASATRAADVIVPSNSEGGVADAIEKFVLSPRGLGGRCLSCGF